MAILTSNNLLKVIPTDPNRNSISELIERSAGRVVINNATLGGTGSVTANVFQVKGNVLITGQVAVITEVTTLTNLTGLFSTIYDGTNTVNLTINGAVLSGAPVGSMFTKDHDSTQPFTVSMSDQCRMTEADLKRIGYPYIVTAKNTADTFIRLHYTTTDSPVNFKLQMIFEYYEIGDGELINL